jgi:hypothetical protein
MNPPTARDCLKVCLTRVRGVSPSRVLFGDEPWLVLLAVVVGGFVFYPLMRDEWPWLVLVLLMAALAHVWYWCCQETRARWSDTTDREAS